MRRFIVTCLLLPLILLAVMPVRTEASTVFHPHWTRCTLHYSAAGGFVHKDCAHYPLVRETRHGIGHTWRETSRPYFKDGTHESIRITWPVFANPLAGCAPSIRRWAPQVAVAHQVTGVPVFYITGVIGAESGGNPDVPTTPDGSGGPGDIGLMQYGVNEVGAVRVAYGFGSWTDDPGQNILTGSGYLLWLYQHDGRGSWDWTVQEYNGGPATTGRLTYLARVRSWGCD